MFVKNKVQNKWDHFVHFLKLAGLLKQIGLEGVGKPRLSLPMSCWSNITKSL